MDFWKWLCDVEGDFFIRRDSGDQEFIVSIWHTQYDEIMLCGENEIAAEFHSPNLKTAVQEMVLFLRGKAAAYARTPLMCLIPKDLEAPPEFRD